MDFEGELQLCKEFLRADQRNFHCWNYRRAIHQRSQLPPLTEFEYSTEKIQENFSNYSAFHHRSCFVKESGMDISALIEQECSVIENAIFTEPDDQSAWWYQQFLFTWLLSQYNELGISLESYVQSLEQQIATVQSLLEIEPNSRWAMNSLVFLVGIFDRVRVQYTSEFTLSQVDTLHTLRKQLLDQLCVIDPNHKNRYLHLIRNLA